MEKVLNRANYDPAVVREAAVFGTPEEVVEKLEAYKAAGVDLYCYGGSFGLPLDFARRSLELFIEKVMPHFEEPESAPVAGAA